MITVPEKNLILFLLTATLCASVSAGLCQTDDQKRNSHWATRKESPSWKMSASGKKYRDYSQEDAAVLLPVGPANNQPLWQRYLAAAEGIHQKGDKHKAKPYYFEALRQLENTPAKDRTQSPQIAALESS